MAQINKGNVPFAKILVPFPACKAAGPEVICNMMEEVAGAHTAPVAAVRAGTEDYQTWKMSKLKIPFFGPVQICARHA